MAPRPVSVAIPRSATSAWRCAAIRSDGTAVAWGDNFYGQLNLPTLPPGESYLRVHGGFYMSAALLGAESTYVTFASGCAGSLPASRLIPRDTPQIGRTLPLGIDHLPLDIAFVGFAFDTAPVPIPLAAIGMPGCDAHLVPATLVAVAGANGRALLPIPVPHSVTLFGTSFVSPAIVLDPAAGNTIGATVSDAARAVIGG